MPRPHPGCSPAGATWAASPPGAGRAAWAPRSCSDGWRPSPPSGSEMDHAFGSDFTLGLEEELFLVEAPGHELSNEASRVLEATERSGTWEADHEAFACEVELRSAPEATPGRAVAGV